MNRNTNQINHIGLLGRPETVKKFYRFCIAQINTVLKKVSNGS